MLFPPFFSNLYFFFNFISNLVASVESPVQVCLARNSSHVGVPDHRLLQPAVPNATGCSRLLRYRACAPFVLSAFDTI